MPYSPRTLSSLIDRLIDLFIPGTIRVTSQRPSQATKARIVSPGFPATDQDLLLYQRPATGHLPHMIMIEPPVPRCAVSEIPLYPMLNLCALREYLNCPQKSQPSECGAQNKMKSVPMGVFSLTEAAKGIRLN